MNRRLLGLSLSVALVVAIGAGTAVFLLDPIRAYLSDGTLDLPPGEYDSSFLRYILEGPDHGPEVRWYSTSDGRGTASWQSFKTPDTSRVPTGLPERRPIRIPSLADFESAFRPMLDAISRFLAFIDPIGVASARTATWDGGGLDNNWNSCLNWDLGQCPVMGDDVVFDSTSTKAATVNIATPVLASFTIAAGYTSTVTVTIAQTNAWGAFVLNAGGLTYNDGLGGTPTITSYTQGGGTFWCGTAGWTVNGNFTKTAGTFTKRACTLTFAADAQVSVDSTSDLQAFHNVVVSNGVTLTLITNAKSGSTLVSSILTVNGTFVSSPSTATWILAGQSATPLIVGANGDLSAGTFQFGSHNQVAVNVPLTTYGRLLLHQGAGATTYSLTGGNESDFTVGTLELNQNSGGTALVTLDPTASNVPVVITGNLLIGAGTTRPGAIVGRASTFTVSGNVSVVTTASYIDFDASDWNVSGSWTNSSTTASWSAGTTSSMVFDSTSSQSMVFAGSNLSEPEFVDVAFASDAGVSVTFTMSTRGLRLSGVMTVQDAGGGTELATSGFSITTDTVVIGNLGTLTAGASSFLIKSWNGSAGSFAAGTSTITVDRSSGTLAIGQIANNVTVNSGITTSFSGSLSWSGVLTLTGSTVAFGSSSLTSSGATTISFASATITMGMGSWNTASATTFTATSSTVSFDDTGTTTLGASQSFPDVDFTAGTRTLSGAFATAASPLVPGADLIVSPSTVATFVDLTFNSGRQFTIQTDATITTEDMVLMEGASWTIGAGVTYNVVLASTLTLSGSLAWGGLSGNRLTLTSTGTWFIVSNAYREVPYADVDHSDASGGETMSACAGGADKGGNSNWYFPGNAGCLGADIADISDALAWVMVAIVNIMILSLVLGVVLGILTTGFEKVKDVVNWRGRK